MRKKDFLAIFLGLSILLVASVTFGEMSGVDYLNASAEARNPVEGVILAQKAIDTGDLSGNNLAQAYYNLGFDYKNQTMYQKSIGAFTTAIAIRTDYYAAYNWRGDAWRQIEKFDRALGDFAISLEIKADYAFPFWNRSIVFELRGELEKAIDDMIIFIELEPDDPDGPDRLEELEIKAAGQ